MIVEWGDAHSGARWVPKEDMAVTHGPLVITNVGFLVKQDKVGVTLTAGLDENGNFAGNFFIPTGMLRKIKKVRY